MKRKILIGTPVKNGLSSRWLTGFVQVLRAHSDIEYCVHDGTAVNFARNEIFHYGMKIGAREVVFVDEDMAWDLPSWNRLLSHVDLDIVGLLYSKKKPGMPKWNVNLMAGKEIEPKTGLCEVEEIGTGFMKVRLDTVAPRMIAEYPECEYYVKTHTEGLPPEDERATSHEFFPMGVMGPRSAGARLERIKMILERPFPTGEGWARQRGDIYKACHDEQLPGNLFGEDYGFCRRARAIGFKIYADFGGPIVGHIGPATFPITPEMVGIDPSMFIQPK